MARRCSTTACPEQTRARNRSASSSAGNSRNELLGGFISFHRFDHGEGQAFGGKVVDGMLNQLASEPLAPRFRDNREIGDATLAGGAVDRGRNVTEDAGVIFRDEDAVRIVGGVIV